MQFALMIVYLLNGRINVDTFNDAKTACESFKSVQLVDPRARLMGSKTSRHLNAEQITYIISGVYNSSDVYDVKCSTKEVTVAE